MPYLTHLHCRECGRRYPLEAVHACEFCFGPLEAVYDYDALAKNLTREGIERGPCSIWRYRDLLPITGEEVVDINAGFTPLIRARRLGEVLGLRDLWLKNDCVNPSYSFKDRPVAVASTRALELGFGVLACASTGNLAGAVAAHAARAGMEAYIFIPADLEQGKIIGASIYGPTLVAVDGNYDEVNRLCSELAYNYPWAFVNVNMRPYYAEGSKSLGYEVAEQLGWRAPDCAVVPLASGAMFTMIWKGLNELHRIGLIDCVPTRMMATQAEGCSPIVEAYEKGTMNIRPVKPNTIAKSLAIGNPADGYYALKTIQDSKGGAAAVSDDEVVEGMKLLAETEGIFAETAGGVTVAGLRRLVKSGAISRDEVTVAFITGNGLKTQEAVIGKLNEPLTIAPTLSAFQEALAARQLPVSGSQSPVTSRQ